VVVRIGRIGEATRWLGRRRHPVRRRVPFESFGIATDRETNRTRSGPGADRPVAPPSSTTPPPAARIVGPLVLARAALRRHGQAKTGASHGACFPSAYSGGAALFGDAIVPNDPAPVLRMAESVGPTSFSRADLALHPLTLAVFRLARQAVTFFPSSCACLPPATGHSPERRFQPGVPVLAQQVCAAWPAFCFAGSAHGIQPFAVLLRPDSSPAFSPRRPTCRLPVASTSMVLVEASAA